MIAEGNDKTKQKDAGDAVHGSSRVKMGGRGAL